MRARFSTWIRNPTVLLAAMALLFLTLEASARVGGGQGFSGGGGGGGSSGGGGDGEILVDIFLLLLHLCIEYPAVGIPLLLVFLIAVTVRFLFFNGGSPRWDADRIGVTHRPAPRGRSGGMARLKEVDTAFSEPVFLDFVGLVHRRALASRGNWDAVSPFVGPGAQTAIEKQFSDVRDVVIGSTTVDAVHLDNRVHRIVVGFVTNVTAQQTHLVRTRWVFERDASARSLPPEETMALGCPNCGNPVETTSLGACSTCGSAITAGQLQWQAVSVEVEERRAVKPPRLGGTGGGEEPSVRIPSKIQPNFAVQMRRFTARHPDFRQPEFTQRVKAVYMAIQTAWSDNRWENARPYVTDPLYQQLRFWMDDYAHHGLRNQLSEIELNSVKIVKIDDDAWYESITVRIFGSMIDVTLDRDGEVVSGNARTARKFSEYWTFLRASGTGAASKPSDGCPSCGAPLDRVGSSGVCGYCDSKITTGRFDWVLSRIDQCEVYEP